jgi:hypothetical protein
MANILGQLFVELKANTAEFISGMSKASASAKSAGKDIESSFSRLGSVASTALAPFGAVGQEVAASLSTIGRAAGQAIASFGKVQGIMAGVAAGAAGLTAAAAAASVGAIALATHSALSAAELEHLSESTGVSIEALSGFQFVAKESGVASETMVRGLERMSRSAFQAATSSGAIVSPYERLGVAVKNADGSMRSAEAIFTDVAARFAAMPNGVTKSALAMQIFGRAGADLIPVLNQGSAGIEKMLALAKALGVQLDSETGQAAVAFEEQLGQLEAAGTGLSYRLMRDLLPAISTVTRAFVDGLKDPQSQLRLMVDGLGFLAKVTIATGETIWTALKQIGIWFGNLAAAIFETISSVGRIAYDVITGNVYDIAGAAKDGYTRLKAIGKNFLDDSRKDWQDYAAFTAGIVAPLAPAKPGAKRTGAPPPPTPSTAAPVDRSLDQARALIAQLRAQTDAELALASATGLSTAQTRLQEAAGRANEIISRLQAQADNLKADAAHATGAALVKLQASYAALTAFIRQYTAEIRASTAAQQVAKDTVALSGELNKATAANEAQIASLGRLATAYKTGGAALADAEIDKQLEAEKQKISDLGEEIDRLSDMQGVSAAALATLRSALDAANLALSAHRDQLEAIRNLKYQDEINQSAAALAGEQPYLEAVNRAYLENGAALREAQVALEAYRYLEAHPGATPEQVAAMAEQYRQQAAQQEATQTAQAAGAFSLTRIQEDQIGQLEKVRAALVAAGESTILVDAQIADQQDRLAQQWDDAALQVGTLRTQFAAFFDELSRQGADFGTAVFGSLLHAVDDVSTQLAKLLVTGKSSFRQLVSSLAEEVTKAGIQNIFSKLFTPLAVAAGGGAAPGAAGAPAGGAGGLVGGIFGRLTGIGGKRGESATAPLFVSVVNAGLPGGAAAPGLIGSILGRLGEKQGETGGGFAIGALGNFDWTGAAGASAGAEASGGGGLGGLFASIGKAFGGFLQSGGDVRPGRAYVVGERAPEFFVPNQPGQIRPALNLAGGRGGQTTIVNNFNGVKDVDLFRRSESQIMTQFHRQSAIAYARNPV